VSLKKLKQLNPKSMFVWVVLWGTLTLMGKLIVGLNHGYPLALHMMNLPFRMTYELTENIPISVVSNLSITRAENQVEIESLLTHSKLVVENQSHKLVTRADCFGIGNDVESLEVVICKSHDAYKITTNRSDSVVTLEDPSKYEALISHEDTFALYVGNGTYQSLFPLVGNRALEVSKGHLASFIQWCVHTSQQLVVDYGIEGFLLVIIVLRLTCSHHDIYQSKLHVLRILGKAKGSNGWRILVNTLHLVVMTLLFIHCMSYLPAIDMGVSKLWLLAFCYVALLMRCYLQGSGILSVECFLLISILTCFAINYDRLSDYYFFYFATSSILIGVVRYLGSHKYVRIIRNHQHA
jgi:hypothetical protein